MYRNIQRIIFHEVSQPSSDGIRLVPPSRIKQIGGRAGRFGFGGGEGRGGIVTCLNPEDMEYMKECMNTPNEEYKTAGIQPPSEIIEELSCHFPTLPLVAILAAIKRAGRYSSHYSPCQSDDMRLIAFMLEEYPSLSITEKLTLSAAPVQLRDIRIIKAFQFFIKSLAERRPCPFQVDLGHHHIALDHLSLAESYYRTLDLYLWLGSRFPNIFVDREEVMVKREECSNLVTRLLSKITHHRKKVNPPLVGITSNLGSLSNVLKDLDGRAL